MGIEIFCAKSTSNLKIGGQLIPFADQAEHVGTVRSIHGNAHHLMSRFSAHRKAMFAVLPVGLAKGHRGNPAASIRAHSLYCSPVLLSGISTLILKKSEMRLVDQHIKQTLQRLQKLCNKTPNCLPGTAANCLWNYLHSSRISSLPNS